MFYTLLRTNALKPVVYVPRGLILNKTGNVSTFYTETRLGKNCSLCEEISIICSDCR
jgi:hypothetical protein